MTTRYVILIEPTATGYSAYVPDLPGCVAAAGTRDAVEQLAREAVEFHLEGLRADGEPVPPAHTYATFVEVAA